VVTKAVQKSNITFSDVRDYFASLCKRFPEMEEYIGVDAQIIHSKAFKSALVKIQSRREGDLTIEEHEAVVCFKKGGNERVDLVANSCCCKRRDS